MIFRGAACRARFNHCLSLANKALGHFEGLLSVCWAGSTA